MSCWCHIIGIRKNSDIIFRASTIITQTQSNKSCVNLKYGNTIKYSMFLKFKAPQFNYGNTTYRVIHTYLDTRNSDNPLWPSSRWGVLAEKLYSNNTIFARNYLNNFYSLYPSKLYVRLFLLFITQPDGCTRNTAQISYQLDYINNISPVPSVNKHYSSVYMNIRQYLEIAYAHD